MWHDAEGCVCLWKQSVLWIKNYIHTLKLSRIKHFFFLLFMNQTPTGLSWWSITVPHQDLVWLFCRWEGSSTPLWPGRVDRTDCMHDHLYSDYRITKGRWESKTAELAKTLDSPPQIYIPLAPMARKNLYAYSAAIGQVKDEVSMPRVSSTATDQLCRLLAGLSPLFCSSPVDPCVV